MRVFANTDVGMARDINQDSFYISGEEEEIKLYILADGMGGYNGGEIASSLAVESVRNYIKNNYHKEQTDKEELAKLVKNSLEYANMVVYDKSRTDINLSEMGTTIDVCLIYNNRAIIGHIGDSRVYRIRNNIFRKLTTDHSYVEKLVKDGKISKEEALYHPKRNMLMRALGCTPYVEPDMLIKGFQKNDIILMCSDGLTNMVSEKEIHDIIKLEIKTADKFLVDAANNTGGLDNITVIIIENN
ncbi:MAG: Stp1/IreP family PP2C-type Ser/Thr phosphatase [Lachnospiraceae bacterium]|jgi:protein phosphatase|nr:Stp1/IreP family PP2C-type Ser/Thr phosphatase [Lachnospiraceae bacterium]